jgi:hypothetical protein
MKIMSNNAELLRKAVEAGGDPFTVELHDAAQSGTPKFRGNKSSNISKFPLSFALGTFSLCSYDLLLIFARHCR